MLFFYNHLKGKQITAMLNLRYFTELLQFAISIFEYELPETVRAEYLERYLNCEGLAGLKKVDGGYLLGIGGTYGPIDQYGIGTRFEGNTIGDDGKEGNYIAGTIGEDIAICWHNSTHTPNLDIVRTADQLTEYDKSIYKAVQVARAQPVFVARDKSTQDAITDAAGSILDGDYVAVLSKNPLAEYNGQKGLELLPLTNPDVARVIQYLNEGMDKCYQRYYQKYGQAQQATSKHSTTLLDELHGSDSVSFVAVEDMLHEREKFCEMAQSIWGDVFRVRLSPIWRDELERYRAETAKPAAELEQIKAEAKSAEEAAADPEQEPAQLEEVEEVRENV